MYSVHGPGLASLSPPMSFSPLSAPFVIHPGFHEYSFIERANDLHLCVGLDEPIRTVRCSNSRAGGPAYGR